MLGRFAVLLLMVAMGWGCAKAPEPPSKGSEVSASKEATKGAPAPTSNTAPKAEAPAKPKSPSPTTLMQGQPALTEVLDAEKTLFFAGIERLDKFVEWGIELARRSPLGGNEDFNRFLNPSSRVAFLGFDPTDPFAWAVSGLDPNLGVALVLDRRLVGQGRFAPILLLRITNREKLTTTLEKIGISAQFSAAHVEVFGARYPVRLFRGWTAILLDAANGAALQGPFENFSQFAGEGLITDPTAAELLKIDSKGFRAWAYGSLVAASRLVPDQGGQSVMSELAAKIPALSLRVGPEKQTLRLAAERRTAVTLRNLVTPRGKVPNFPQNLRDGRIVVRANLNIPLLIQGLVSLLPKGMSPLGTQLIEFRNEMPKALGITYEDLGFAFSGHFALSLDPKGGAPTVLVGLRQPARADVVVRALMTKFKEEEPRAKIGAYNERGLRGFEYVGSAGTVFTARRGDFLAIAPTKDALRATFAGTGTLMTHPASKALLEPMAFMVWGPMDGILRGAGELAKTMEALWKPYTDRGVLITRVLADEKGLLASSSAFEVVLFAAAAAGTVYAQVAASFDQAKAEITMLKLRSFQASVQQFQASKGRLPSNAEGVGVVFGKGVGGAELTTDGWGRQIQYFSPARRSKDPKSYELVSWGADGLPDSADDLRVAFPR